MEPVKVPQHLELEDVLAFGLGLVDLALCVSGVVVASWLYLNTPGPTVLRAVVAAVALITGGLLGAGRIGGRTLRDIALNGFEYLVRSRRRTYQGDEL